VDGTVSGSCPVAGFGISSVEPWGSATTVLGSKMDLREIGCFVQCSFHDPGSVLLTFDPRNTFV